MAKINLYLKKIEPFFFILATTTSFFISVQKPIWLDEVATLINSDTESLRQLVFNFYQGADTNPPFYFIVVYILKNLICSDLIFLRGSSLIFYCLGLLILRKSINDQSQKQIILLIACTIPFLNFYLSSELRAYALQFFLGSCFVYFYKNVDSNRNAFTNPLGLILASTLLLYTHYFSIFYLIIITSIEFLFFLKTGNYKALSGLTISLGLFSFWIPAIFIQQSIYHGYSWHEPFSLIYLYRIPYFYLGNSIYIIIIIFLIFGWKLYSKKRLIKKIKSIEKKHIVLITTLFFPFVGAILSSITNFPFVERYFTLSILSFLLITSFVLSHIYSSRVKILVLSLFTMFIIVKSYNCFQLLKIEKRELKIKLNLLSSRVPIVCESPHHFYPLYYYAKIENLSSPFLLLDRKSSTVQGNSKNTIFDYYGNTNLKKYFNLKNVLEFDKFHKYHKKYYLLDEKDRQLFEYKVKNNNLFEWKVINKNLIFIHCNK